MKKETEISEQVGSAVVMGGGIGGMQAALDLAETGIKVYLVESSSSIGGRMTQLDKTFPTNECAMCVVSPKLVDCARHHNIEIISYADLESVEGEAGRFNVRINKRARYIDEEKCSGCGSCIINCPVRKEIQVIPEEGKEVIKLDPEVERVVNNVLQEHRDKKGALMLVLQSINAIYNYFPEEILKYISRDLDVPLSSILTISTFYNAFSLKPRGRHTISVCMGTTCYVKGSERILSHLSELLETAVEETTEDMKFTIKSVRCLGCCSIAPAIMVNDKVYGGIKPNDLPTILKDFK